MLVLLKNNCYQKKKKKERKGKTLEKKLLKDLETCIIGKSQDVVGWKNTKLTFRKRKEGDM
jgi:hypothetical protein